MCLAVYIASNQSLPLVEWKEERPAFNIVRITKGELAVKRQFNNPIIVYAGSHEGCGCGFFKEGEVGEELTQVQENYNSLVSYLSGLVKAGVSIEIYSCWEGDQGAEPEYRQKLSLAALGAEDFEFKEKAYYEIT